MLFPWKMKSDRLKPVMEMQVSANVPTIQTLEATTALCGKAHPNHVVLEVSEEMLFSLPRHPTMGVGGSSACLL